ncbi:hypothetical protein B484DRAFT_56326 [Ochromonadaceae sp. CCMP2298]|nr:hypothetical protein B484DRAFT_56326 [Ochromonadaceae sp. CCMP2298]
MMDPMGQFEEDQRRKEEAELKELRETIVLDDATKNRDMFNKGRNVHPSGKQRKVVQLVAATLRFAQNRRKSTGTFGLESIEEVAFVDLAAQPRIFLHSGSILRLEPDSILRRYARRHMFMFNDLVLICGRNAGKHGEESYEVQQVLWLRELRIKVIIDSSTGRPRTSTSNSAPSTGADPTPTSTDSGGGGSFSFELVVARTRKKAQYCIPLTCDDDAALRTWVSELESALLAYHREEPLGAQPGWVHEVLQGSLHSAACLGDLPLLRRHLRDIHFAKQGPRQPEQHR